MVEDLPNGSTRSHLKLSPVRLIRSLGKCVLRRKAMSCLNTCSYGMVENLRTCVVAIAYRENETCYIMDLTDYVGLPCHTTSDLHENETTTTTGISESHYRCNSLLPTSSRESYCSSALC